METIINLRFFTKGWQHKQFGFKTAKKWHFLSLHLLWNEPQQRANSKTLRFRKSYLYCVRWAKHCLDKIGVFGKLTFGKKTWSLYIFFLNALIPNHTNLDTPISRIVILPTTFPWISPKSSWSGTSIHPSGVDSPSYHILDSHIGDNYVVGIGVFGKLMLRKKTWSICLLPYL